ncbi:endonuclease/exonuclease/phosphatase (EEP) superfamily protein YafD [Devosia subaequoris]|uniref:Endonuclease/exonuclease/phosphatase (EEP) superfamily protein YafD n=1 Tax=Devosia subaequoris TaxID=395930 RepID=A0A7W6NBC6_9HYPH|nr:endonuclease/exonuclease/phosphatase family protein [Devosia subaequoris]MBB4051554.1 endonuclease/exonuclease/phosphatase (EEP) superfamily protein YafD [Devosia subaequoris]MCP1209147.1 endonuclease/exonuclease/phosphatase family protein [Devosia subaequoris]
MWGKAEFRGGLLVLLGALIVVLAVVVLGRHLPGLVLLQSLRFHMVAAGVVLALALILLGGRWRGAFALVPLLAAGLHGYWLVGELYASRTMPEEAPVAQFRFLSFNVLAGNRHAEELVAAILADQPEIVLVMETPGIESHLAQMAKVYPYRLGCERTESCDISLFSQLPIEEGGIQIFQPFNRERLVTARVRVDGQPVTIVGAHLTKPYDELVVWQEMVVLRRLLDGIEGPVVLAGDFNSTIWTESLGTLMERARLTPGPSTPATWPVRLGAFGVPIDNMLTRDNARILTLESGESYGSNHRPLWASIGLYAAE